MSAISVLVVEDEPVIRMNVTEMLEEEGFEVHQADSSASALATLYSHQTVHCLFTDVDLGTRMTGLDLAAAVRDEWPDIKIIVASGKQHLLPSEVPDGRFFAKPYNFEQLASAIRDMVVLEAVQPG